jgi:hypothetical protein
MRLTAVSHPAVLLIAGLLVGCGPDSQPTPSGAEAPPGVEASSPVPAELDKYMKDGNVFVEVVPVETIRKVMSRQKGNAQSSEIDWEIWTGKKTVSFVREAPEGKLFKVVSETKGQDKTPRSGTTHYLLAKDGLYFANELGAKITSIPIIPAELAVGKEWTGEPLKAAPDSEKGYGKIEAKESVEVPAGKFEAYKIVVGTVGNPHTATIWYTPGVGIVKDGRGSGLELKEAKGKM